MISSFTALCVTAAVSGTAPSAYAQPEAVVKAASDASIYGWCTDCDSKALIPSICRINSGDMEYVRDIETMAGYYTRNDLTLANGFMKDGVVSGYVKEFYGSGSNLMGEYWLTYDFATGNILTNTQLSFQDTPPVFNVMAYVSEENLMYGVGNLVNLPGFYFMAVSPQDPIKPVMLKTVDQQLCTASSFCYNALEDCFYLINTSRQIVRVQKDGYVEAIATIDLDNLPNYYSALWWNAEDNNYYWNPIWSDHSSIATLDMKTGNATILYNTPNKNQFAFFISEQQAAKSPLKPAKPEFVSSNFPQGALSGSLTYKLPAVALDGSALSGSLKCYSIMDGQSHGEYQGTPGADVNVPFTDLSEGEHEFIFYVATSQYESDKIVDALYIGVDTPDAPADVVIENNNLTWSPVTTSVHGGYVDYESIEYEISLNDELVGTTKANEFTLPIPEDAPMAEYTARVVAIAGEKRSEAGVSNKVVVGAPLSMPVVIPPTQEDFNLCTIIDSNGDGRKWFLMGDAFGIGYTNRDVYQNDWLFLPPTAFTNADSFYNIEFEACTRDGGAPSKENLTVCIAKQPDPESAVVIMEEFPLTTIRYEYEKYSKLFQVEEAGTYYIGFHCTSDPDQTGIFLKNIKLYDSNLPGDAPDVVTDLKGEVAKGEYEATVTFNFPTLNLYKQELDADAELTATITSALESVTVEGTPGSEGTAKVKVEDGDNTISVTVSLGEYTGPAATTTVHAGVVAPETPGNIQATVSDDMLTVHLTWDAVTTGVDDGYIIPEDIQYQVCEIVQTQDGLGFEYVGEPTYDTSFDYTIEAGSEQRTCQLTVLAFNSAGDNGQIERGVTCVVGTPYSLPYSDDFEPEGFNTEPWLIYNPSEEYTAQWGLYWASGLNPSWGNNVILWSVTTEAGALGREGMPRFSTLNTDAATLKLDIYVGDRAPKMTVLAEYPGCTDLVEVGTINKVKDVEFQNVEMDLPEELMNKYWVGLFFQVEFENTDQLFALNSVSVQSKDVSLMNLTSSEQIIGGIGNITLRGLNGNDVAIYSLDGKTIVTDTVNGDNAVYNIAKGIYVVKAGKKTAKVSVR